MREGMLWYDNESQKDMKEKVAKAVNFFKSKYGYLPQTCYVNPLLLEGDFILNKKVKVQSSERVIKNHIWLEFPQE